jgi:uncharacterized protein YjbI with pentapeptide repeats
MTDPLGSGSVPIPDPTNSIRQTLDQNQGQVIAQMVGGLAVGQLTVYLSQVQTATTESIPPSVELGQNPYQGLLTFRETDGDRFYGRSLQIEQLWQRFQQLHGDRSTIRILPIYGPSGSGKSSLARAGLIPALGKQPLPGCDHSRVVVLTPGNHPLEALSTVLARIATQDPMPVAKTREFKEELLQPNSQKEFDGLRRIADVFPNISLSPLIVLVDQFEEIYTLCTDAAERHAFVENLLCAASDRAQRVSIILTLRSDFLGATQQHPQLNKLFSTQGFLVPIMQPEELAIAITEPAKRAGYTLDKAIVQWLIEETQDREAALPLLQFALTQIWEGLRNGVDPADTLQQISGVGGALANEAKRLYHSLTSEQQQVARCIFLALVQINEDNKSTRRRAAISELITGDSSEVLVREVIDRFARPGVWILVMSSNEQQVEMLEVAHEALIRNWTELQEWLKEHWVTLRQKRRIEQAAIEWREKKKSKDYLWQGRSLRDAKDFLKTHKNNSETELSSLSAEFIHLGVRKQRVATLKSISLLLFFPFIGTLIAINLLIIGIAQSILSRDDCQRDFFAKGALEYMWWTGQAGGLRDIQLCNEELWKIKLPGVVMLNSNFDDANLSNADFRGAILSSSSFQGASLARADFSERAVLIGVDFGCKEYCTTLSETNFENSDLSKVVFQGAQLRGANFRGTNLTNADLDGAEGLTEEQLEKAVLCQTILPDYLDGLSGNRDCRISVQ